MKNVTIIQWTRYSKKITTCIPRKLRKTEIKRNNENIRDADHPNSSQNSAYSLVELDVLTVIKQHTCNYAGI